MSSVGRVPDGRYFLVGDSNYEKKDEEKSEDFKQKLEHRRIWSKVSNLHYQIALWSSN